MALHRILIYKRTHVGDPNNSGVFGNEDCMGRVRRFPFDAVIGVGGVSGEPMSQGLSRKINWVGIKPTKVANTAGRGDPLAYFKKENFRLFEENGPLLSTLAPNLAKRVYGNGARFLFTSLSPQERADAEKVICRILSGEFDHLQDPASIRRTRSWHRLHTTSACRTTKKRCVSTMRRRCR